MATNSQLSTTEPKKKIPKRKRKTEQTTITGTKSHKWRSHGRLSAGRARVENGGMVQGIRSINGRYKTDRDN